MPPQGHATKAGEWTPPQTFFGAKTAGAGDAAAGFIDVVVKTANQKRFRIWNIGCVSSDAGVRVQPYWHNHDINDKVPLASFIVAPTYSGFFEGKPFIEVYPCDYIGARFYGPAATQNFYANAVIQELIV